MIKLLQEHGFEWKRQKGSHVVLRKGSKICVVPVHDSNAKWQSDVEANRYLDAAAMERYNQYQDRNDMLVADYEAQLAKMGQSLNLDQAAFDRSVGYSQASATRTAAYGTLLSGAASMAGTVADYGKTYNQYLKGR